MKIFKLCVSQDIINKVKRQLRKSEKIFVTHISNKELVARKYKKTPITQLEKGGQTNTKMGKQAHTKDLPTARDAHETLLGSTGYQENAN